MIALQAMVIGLLLLAGTAAALARDPFRQMIMSGLNGMLLIALFVVFQAPDVALSAMAASAVASPVMIAIALAKVHAHERDER